MSEVIERGASRIALRVSRDANRRLLAELFPGHDLVDIIDTVPENTDLCIVDERGLSHVETMLIDWKQEQQPTDAPVLLLSESSGANPWEQYAGLLDGQIDAIQPIPAPRAVVRARVEPLLEKRQYSQELASERQLIEQIFDTSPIAKTVLDTEGHIVRANQRAEEVLGLSVSELTGRAYDDPEWRIIDENGDPVPSEELPFSQVMTSGDPVYGYEHGIEHPDGERVWLSINMGPMYDENGEIEYLVSSIEDVTERKRLERELRESEELHRTTLSNITDTVFITDDGGQFTYVCPNVHFIFGYTDDEVREMDSVEELLGTDPAPDDFSEGDVRENIPLQVTGIEGEEYTVLVTVNSVSIQDGTRLYSVRDVTKQEEAERDLRKTQRAVEATGHAIYIIDPDGEIEYVNPAFEEITGYTQDEVIGKTPQLLTSGDAPENHYAELWETIQSGDVWEMEVLNERKDGGQYYAVQTIARITDTDGELEGFVAILTDITEHKDRLQQLRVMDRVLRHNLRNDMTVIRSFAEMIREESEEPLSSYGERIVEHSDYLLHLTDKQRKITEVLSSEPNLESIDIIPAIQRVVGSVSSDYPHAHISLDLPEAAAVSATTNLEQAIEELVTNAIKHADEDVPDVEMQVIDATETVQIRITDTGPGIPEMDRQVVLGEHEIEPVYHGSGLGLWFVSWVIRRSNGSLRIEDNAPRGSVVVITLRKPTDGTTGSSAHHGTNDV